MITRRESLPWICGAAGPRAWSKIPSSRVSAITDEVGRSSAEALQFCERHQLQWVETRFVPGTKQGYWDLPSAEQEARLAEFRDRGIGVSFVASGLLTCPAPGTTPALRPGETVEQRARRMAAEAPRFERRMEDLRRVIDFAHRARCGKIRFFAFRRVEAPVAIYPRIAELLAPMIAIAEAEGIQLLLENEASCNVNTCVEIAAMMRLLPSKSVGVNWDPGNARTAEIVHPDGYAKLPVARIANVQVKGADILPGYPNPVPWPALLSALERDGYLGPIALETHTKDRVADSEAAMRVLLRLAAGVSAANGDRR